MSDEETEIDFSNMDGFLVLDEVGEDDSENSDDNTENINNSGPSCSATNSMENGPNEQNNDDLGGKVENEDGQNSRDSKSVSLSPEHPSTYEQPLSNVSLSPEKETPLDQFRQSRSPLPYRSRSPLSPARRFSRPPSRSSRSPLSPYRRYPRSPERRRFSRSRSPITGRFSRSPSPRSPGGTLLVRRPSRSMSPRLPGGSALPGRFSRSPPPMSPGGTALISRSSRSPSPRSPGTLLVQRSFRSPGAKRFSRSPSPRSPGGSRPYRNTAPPGDTPSLSPDRPSVHSSNSPREYRISRSPSPKRSRHSYRRSRSRSRHRSFRSRRRRSGSWRRRSRTRSRSRSRKLLASAEPPTELMLSVQQQVEAMYDKALAQLGAGSNRYQQYNVPPPSMAGMGPMSVPPPTQPPLPQYLIMKLPIEAQTIPVYDIQLSDLKRSVLDFLKDPNGYKWVTEKLKTASTADKSAVFDKILPEVFVLATNPYATHVVQDYFESLGSDNQKVQLARKLQFHTKVHSLNHYGSQVIIKALENVTKEQVAEIAKGLEGNVVNCAKDTYGTLVVQKCIEMMESENLQFMVDAIKGSMFLMSTHVLGCRVIQKLLEHGLAAQIAPLLDEIIITEELIKHSFGNYVVQTILEFGRPEDRSKVVSCVRGQVLALSQDKYSQRLVDKTVEKALKFQRAALIDEVCGAPIGEQSSLMTMLQHKYAHFVVQKMMQLAEPRQMSVIVEKIKPHVKVIEALPHGRHILMSLQKYFYKQKSALAISKLPPTPIGGRLPNNGAPIASDVNVPKTLTDMLEAIEGPVTVPGVVVKVEKED